MKLEQIINEWKKDAKIDEADLSNESAKTPLLHSKYYEWYTQENLLFEKIKHDYHKLLKLKSEYYGGKLSQEELETLGWPQHDLLVIKQDMDKYLDADQDIINILLKISLQEEKVNALKEIVKCLHSRPFAIKNMLDFIKWSSGG